MTVFHLSILAMNLTDFIIDTFGWDFMQLLWDPFNMLFDFFENLLGINLGPLWEILFT
jgi:hypothetical protein